MTLLIAYYTLYPDTAPVIQMYHASQGRDDLGTLNHLLFFDAPVTEFNPIYAFVNNKPLRPDHTGNSFLSITDSPLSFLDLLINLTALSRFVPFFSSEVTFFLLSITSYLLLSSPILDLNRDFYRFLVL